MPEHDNKRLWGRWVAANATGELVGLGATFAAGFASAGLVDQAPVLVGTLASTAMMTSAGAVEGAVVGLAQWLVVARRFPTVGRRAWVSAMMAGAVVAWFLGSIPSTAMSLGAGQEAGPGPAKGVVLIMASMLGAVAGAVLALPQWLVLRRSVEGAWRWLPANAAAWLVGMPVIFVPVDAATRASSMAAAVAMMALALLLAGAAVGAIHGAVLVRLRARSQALAVT